MMRTVIAALLTATCAGGGFATLTSAAAATISRDGDHIVLTGNIEAGDADRLKSALAPGVKIVDLDSPGGLLAESLEIGRTIRRERLITVAHGNCMSGCALAWAAGVKRLVADGGRVGWHCPIVAWQCQKNGRGLAIAYLTQMDATPAMLARQMDAGSTASLYLTTQEVAEAQIVADGRGLPPEEWQDAPPPPPRRRPPAPEQYYGPPPGPPPGWIFIPAERRAMPCLPTLLTFGVLRFCI
jgi:hypothetical protein